MVVEVQAPKSYSNGQNYREPFLLRFTAQWGWQLLLIPLPSFVTLTVSLDPTFRNRDEAFGKTEELFMREMKENRFFCLFSYLGL